LNILLVDDEEEILSFLSYALLKDGYNVRTALNGQDAIDLASKMIPDMIILDVMMPGIDGIETCKRLKQNPDLKNTIIAFLSARSDDQTKISGLEVGADDFIEKPIKPQLFIAKIKSLSRRKVQHKNKPGRIELKDIRINLEKRKVRVNENIVNLTKIEYNILLMFVQEPDKIFTREEIYSIIWGELILVGDRTLDVHVRNLRKKIGKENIQTYKGVGYSFNLIQNVE